MKKKNPQDATLRNVRAQAKRLDTLEKFARDLLRRIRKLEGK